MTDAVAVERLAVERLAVARLSVPQVGRASGLNRFAKLVCFCAFLLLIAGALVTSTGSSLSVPDWPLSFGKVLPPMLGGVRFEHGHRMIAGTVALLTFVLAGWLAVSEPRAWVRRLGYAASAAIVLQAVLGGLTVLLRLPPAVSISHACLAEAVFCLLVCIAQATTPWFESAAPSGSANLWKMGFAATGITYAQVAFGALLRHTGMGLPLHALWAGVVTLAVMIVGTRGAREDFLFGPSALMSLILPLQLMLGYLSFRARFSSNFAGGFSLAAATTATHLAVGALLLGACMTWTLRAVRCR